ncbi:MAG TPA: SAM-dependent methyltransferase [Streptosporangiaceae bacterium]|nr:SAM-dependent methyltransferase [Streptosporangiaceae bacterium]
MQKQQLPSQTAFTAAAARAAHLIVDQAPPIFEDGLAAAMLGEQAEEFISYHRRHGEHLVLSAARAQATCRSRHTENCLADAVNRGTTQYVMLGAGLDSFAYRSPLAGAVRVFEVDHPATQEYKRARLIAAGIPVPGTTAFVPADFEHDSLAGRLRAAGFNSGRPALVSWLGVTMYLTRPAISQTLAEIGQFAAGTELITDYLLPPGLRDAAGDSYAGLVGPAMAQRGEPWLTCLAPDEMSALLAKHGFGMAGHVSQRDSVSAALWDRSDTLRPISLSMLAHGTVPS